MTNDKNTQRSLALRGTGRKRIKNKKIVKKKKTVYLFYVFDFVIKSRGLARLVVAAVCACLSYTITRVGIRCDAVQCVRACVFVCSCLWGVAKRRRRRRRQQDNAWRSGGGRTKKIYIKTGEKGKTFPGGSSRWSRHRRAWSTVSAGNKTALLARALV